MRRRTSLAIAAATLAAGAGVAVVVAMPAHADTQLCDTWGTTTLQNGKYIVMNNVWGASTAQCINVTTTGFSRSPRRTTTTRPVAPRRPIQRSTRAATMPPAPQAARSRRQLATLGDVTSSVAISVPTSGSWDAAYDIWLDPTARKDGQNTGAEIMIWVNHLGLPQPVGSKVGTATLAGTTWDVWYGNSGWNVISYVRQTPATSFDGSITVFASDAITRGTPNGPGT